MRIFTLLVVMGATLTGAATARAITLSTDGETDYVIVLA